jgi:argininosuccinate lyase
MEKLWGGRFDKKTNTLVEEFTKSIHFDQKLAEYDVIGSLTHIGILKKAKLLNAQEYRKLESALDIILAAIKDGSFFKNIDPSFEDIHSYVQHLVEKKAGKVALKLHTCRSRNDQVAFDIKAYCFFTVDRTSELIQKFIGTLQNLSEKNKKIIIPGYTHLQHAIPIKLSAHFGAYVEMLLRDQRRLDNAFLNIHLSLGAGALAGTMIESAKYNAVASAYLPKHVKPTPNSIDTVSDRDFIIEILSALAIIGMHLSRLAEDMILWASKEFNFIDIDDAFCTGSSLMPQKKNPDVLELVRGYSGRLYGNLVNVFVMMKGLPLSYNRDMQLDKEPLFDSFKIVQDELKVLTELFKNVTFNAGNIAKQLDDETLYATDLADHLVKNGVAFTDAHTSMGKLIREKLQSEKNIVEMSAEKLKSFHPLLTPAIVKKVINPEYSVKSKKSIKRRRLK